MTLGNAHDIVDSHTGVLDDAQIASGTPTAGQAPLSNGDGTRTWSDVSGGGSVAFLVDDSTTYSDPGVRFTGNVSGTKSDWLGSNADGDPNMGTDYDTQLYLRGGSGNSTAEIYAFDNNVGMYADFYVDSSIGGVEAYATDHFKSSIDNNGATSRHEFVGGNGILVPLLSADPSGGNSTNGQIYYNTSTHKFRGRANGAWVDLN